MNNLHWSQCSYVVIDVEGSGQKPHDLVEIATVRIKNKQIEDIRCWGVRPSRPITDRAIAIHGITNEAAEKFDPWSKNSSEILAEMEGRVIVGHNVSIDAQLIRNVQPDWQPLAMIDTLALAKRVLPSSASYSLSSLVKYLLPDEEGWTHHRAEGDALMTARLFLKLASILETQINLNFLTLAQIAHASEDGYLRSQQGNLF